MRKRHPLSACGEVAQLRGSGMDEQGPRGAAEAERPGGGAVRGSGPSGAGMEKDRVSLATLKAVSETNFGSMSSAAKPL